MGVAAATWFIPCTCVVLRYLIIEYIRQYTLFEIIVCVPVGHVLVRSTHFENSSQQKSLSASAVRARMERFFELYVP